QSFGVITPAAAQLGNVDTSYNQSLFSINVGGDYSWEGNFSPNDSITIGAYAGYVNSLLSFKSSPTTFLYQGPTFGISGTYLNEGFFADVLLKADILSLNVGLPSLGGTGFTGTQTNARNFGVISSGGYRFDFNSWYLEPSISLAYVGTSIDS